MYFSLFPQTLVRVESLAFDPPVLDGSTITAGNNVSMNVTKFGGSSRKEERGASGLLISLGVSEKSLVGSRICTIQAWPSPQALVFSIVTVDDERDWKLFSLDPHTGWCSFQ